MAPTDDFESDVLGEYVESLRTGKSRPYMKSLPVPKTQDGPVLKVRNYIATRRWILEPGVRKRNLFKSTLVSQRLYNKR
jgi:hypothetical protein